MFFCFLLATASALSLMSPLKYFDSFFVNNSPLPFPQWLSDFTGLTEWPGIDPPYIPMDFIDFNRLPEGLDSWIHREATCGAHLTTAEVCSFDCANCVAFDDVYSCPKLSQSFDDGPTPFTPQLTGVLRSKQTFFTIGINIVRFPQVYRETADQGHVMGSHTWSHPFLPSLTNEQIVAQLQWSIWAMNATYGHLPKWFRPPYGGVDERVRGIIRQFGMQCALWNYDTMDWGLEANADRTDEDVVNDVAQYKRFAGGTGLILEHDSVQRTVTVATKIYEELGLDQMTVPQCAGGIEYVRQFDKPRS